MKKLFTIATTAALAAINVLGTTAGAVVLYDEYGENYWKEYIRIWEEEDEEALLEYIWDNGDDDPIPVRNLDSEYFTSETNYIIKVKLRMNEAVGIENYDDNYWFYIVLNDATVYATQGKGCVFPERERNCCTTAEILQMSGVPDTDMIFMVKIFYNNSCDYDAELESVDFYPCTEGWNTIDGDKYYVKSDGTLATKSMTIDGVRYKFAKSGVCEGKYTGWTKSSRGKRYWKNGELLKNKTLRTKSGKVYKLDRNGYAALKV